MIVAMTFLGVMIFVDLSVNGMVINILMMIVAGAHIGAVKRSAIPPPIAAAASAYGVGSRTAAK